MNDASKDTKSIFCEAIENWPPENWEDYLDEACGENAELRQRVGDLLQAHVALGTLPDRIGQANESEPDDPVAEQAGNRIGRYTLVREVGEGGMGVVYLAEQQEPVRRQVALKIIKPGMDTRQVIARFQRERQSLALMDHPYIAGILDAGATESGRPYFVMDWVPGLPIIEYCDQHKLDVRQRLQLFVLVCQAVQHAHQKGVIHRDIKPSNVLVAEQDGVPAPKLIDFGIAKAVSPNPIEHSVFTGIHQLLGTPCYMSPEQTEGNGSDVDTRSDIYSLGILLYELLTGVTPFGRSRLNGSDLDEVRRIIRHEEPPWPSSRLGAAADPTVAANRNTDTKRLSSQLRHELDWIVSKALRKERERRYPTASDFVRDIQRYLRDEPIEARPPTPADRALKWARRHRPIVYSAIVSVLIATVILLVSTAVVLAAYQREKTQRGIAEQNATTARDNANESRENSAEAERNYETAREAVQQMLTRVADKELARIPEMKEVRLRLLEDAAAFYTKLSELNPQDSRVYYERAKVHRMLGKYDDALRDFGTAVQHDPQNAVFHSALGTFLCNRSDGGKRDPHRGLENLQRAVELDPKNSDHHYWLAWGYIRVDRFDEARESLRRMEELDPGSATTFYRLTQAFNWMGDHESELRYLPKAMALDPSNAWTQLRFAQAIGRQGDYERALIEVDKALELFDRPNATETHYFYDERGEFLWLLGRHRDALAEWERSLELAPLRPTTYKRRAYAHFYLKNYPGALADLTRAVDLKPRDTSNIWWTPLALVAKCPDEDFREGVLQLVEQTVLANDGVREPLVSRAILNEALGHWQEAAKDWCELAQSEPENAATGLVLASHLATCPDPKLWNRERMSQLAALAAKLESNSKLRTLWTLWGAAFLRAGEHQAAVDALQRSVQLHAGGNPLDWLLLSVAYGRLGNEAESRRWCEQAFSASGGDAQWLAWVACWLPVWIRGADSLPGVAFVSELPWVRATRGWGPATPERNRIGWGELLTISGLPYTKGIRTDAYADGRPADIVLDVSEYSFTHFKAQAGVMDPNGSVQVHVLVDGKLTYESPILRVGTLDPVSIEVAGAREVVLRALDGGDGHASDACIWGYARFIEAGAEDPLESPPPCLNSATEAAAALFLTSIHAKSKHQELAQRWHDAVVKWIDENQPDDEQLRRYRGAAELVLRKSLTSQDANTVLPENNEPETSKAETTDKP